MEPLRYAESLVYSMMSLELSSRCCQFDVIFSSGSAPAPVTCESCSETHRLFDFSNCTQLRSSPEPSNR